MEMNLFYLIVFFIEALILWQYCSNLFHAKFSSAITGASLLILYGTLFFTSFLNIYWLNTIAFLLANFIFIFLLYETGWGTALFHATVATILMGLGELIILSISTSFARNFYVERFDFVKLSLFTLFSKLIYFFIMYLISHMLGKPREQGQRFGRETLMLTGVPLISFWLILTLATICHTVNTSDLVDRLITISAILILFMNLLIWSIYSHILKKQQEITNMQLQLQREADSIAYYEMLLKQNESQNILIHDIKKHLQSISLLNEQNNQPKIASYIERLVNSSALQHTLQICDNDLLNAILSQYTLRCQEKSIAFHPDIRNNTIDFLSDNDLTSLFCNLLDNAVEAASKQVNSYIELSVLKKPNTPFTILTIENSCLLDPFAINPKKLVSSKKEPKKHGLGLKSVEKVIQKYSGDITMYYEKENKTFHTVITLKSID